MGLLWPKAVPADAHDARLVAGSVTADAHDARLGAGSVAADDAHYPLLRCLAFLLMRAVGLCLEPCRSLAPTPLA